ncbi:MAG: Cache 3/Cache 2 fusion domain-containing protein [Methanolinea sp.]|nr:Cache 3/Cache 2 fusion domain-containing protein [Methanolinea sp.]
MAGFSQMKIGTKILVLCLVLVAVPTLLLGIVAYTSSTGAIQEQIDELLSTEISDIHKMTSNNYQLAQMKLNGDLSVLHNTFYGYGTPEISGGKLVLKGKGGQSYVVNDNFEIVDQIEKMTGSKATIFQKTDGQAIRISTNVVGADGRRALGTPVSDAVYDAVIRKGETYYGVADVVGKTYITAYEPIRNANGEIIGILFVGVPEETVYGALKKEILSTKLGQSGYVFVMDSKGTLLVHPSLQGQNMAGEKFIQEMIATKDKVRDKPGKISYVWEGKEVDAYYMYFPALDWIIGSRVNPAEYMGPVDNIRNAIIIILVASIAIGALVSIMFGRSIARRMGDLVALGNRVMEGDLGGASKSLESGLESAAGGDEIAEVSKAFANVVKTIQNFSDEIAKVSVAASEGQLSVRGEPSKFKGDYASLIKGLNETLDAIVNPLRMTARYIERIGKGEVPEKITETYRGEFNDVKNSINSCVDGLQGLVECDHILHRLAVNDHTRGVEGKYQGIFGTMADSTNQVRERLLAVTKQINEIAVGDTRELAELKKIGKRSEQDHLLPAIVNCLETVDRLLADTKMLARAAVEGRLDVRADASRHEGEYRTLVEGINATLDAMVKPLNEAMKVCEAYAAGDFTRRFDKNLSVAGDFQKFREALDNIGIQVSKALAVVNQQVTELGASAEEANASIEEVSAGSAQVAKNAAAVSSNAEQSSQGIAEVLKAMEDLSKTIQQVAAKAESVSQLVQQTNDYSRKGIELAKKTEKGMDGITRSSNEVNTIILEIKSQMDKIGEIVNLITDLANQTNLLALNAAIEAARAGDAGRGFAVVATEVKSLAEESRVSAEKIAEMIGNLQKQTQMAAETVAVSNTEVREGSVALKETLENFNKIVEAIDQISRAMTEVAAASEEQAASVEEVTASMNEVNNLVRNTAKEATDSAAVSEETAAAIDQISKVIANVNNIVVKVSTEVSKFKI